MTMDKGLAVIEVNDTGTKGFYIDQDALEFARLNAKIKMRSDRAVKAQKKAAAKAEKAKAERKAYTKKTAAHILLGCAISSGAAWAGIAGLIAPIIYVPVSLFCLCAACIRLGAWFGRSK
jgi:hypothetical protein